MDSVFLFCFFLCSDGLFSIHSVVVVVVDFDVVVIEVLFFFGFCYLVSVHSGKHKHLPYTFENSVR